MHALWCRAVLQKLHGATSRRKGGALKGGRKEVARGSGEVANLGQLVGVQQELSIQIGLKKSEPIHGARDLTW